MYVCILLTLGSTAAVSTAGTTATATDPQEDDDNSSCDSDEDKDANTENTGKYFTLTITTIKMAISVPESQTNRNPEVHNQTIKMEHFCAKNECYYGMNAM